jgi:hypothetical protein
MFNVGFLGSIEHNGIFVSGLHEDFCMLMALLISLTIAMLIDGQLVGSKIFLGG